MYMYLYNMTLWYQIMVPKSVQLQTVLFQPDVRPQNRKQSKEIRSKQTVLERGWEVSWILYM